MLFRSNAIRQAISLDGLPDGIGRTIAADVSVGGTGVLVGVFVGSGVLVEVGEGVSVGFDTRELQDAKAITRTVSTIALMMVFMYFLYFVLMFCDKHPTASVTSDVYQYRVHAVLGSEHSSC